MPRKPKTPATPEITYWYESAIGKKVRVIAYDDLEKRVYFVKGSASKRYDVDLTLFKAAYSPIGAPHPDLVLETIFTTPSQDPTPEEVRATVEAQAIAPSDLPPPLSQAEIRTYPKIDEIPAQTVIPAQRPPTLEEIARFLNLKTQAAINAFHIAVENIQLLDSKQLDYGPGNIAAFGELGVLVRSNDKIERLKNLHRTGKTAHNESADDSWMDLANYGLIAQLIRRNLWG
jgi:hypothetical protein